jgi:multicomponent Na+:H+ antiporter subunit E
MWVVLLLSIPLALLWMVVTSNISPGSFIVGLLVGGLILYLNNTEHIQIDRRRLPGQLRALAIYTVTLLRDIWLSSVDVTKRVLNPNLPINPGILKVETLDPDESEFTAAFSAHGITITPGELVVDFDGSKAMFVHCLDVEASANSAPGAQMKRLKLLRRIAGKE